MKRVLILICAFVLAASTIQAQVPQNFSYQSIARKSNGQPLTSSSIGLRISIRDLTSSGTVVYRETHAASTNGFGLFTISIGSGTVVSGTFAAIDWSLGAKFIEVEADFNGGTSYASMGTSQLLSVPYALYSQNGTPGPTGPQGPVGPQGAPGEQGSAGPAGATGPQGIAGANGLSILNGPNDPGGSTGVDGEFYINTTTNTLFGPKAGGAWPIGVFLVGPAGPAGNDGPQGIQGIQGIQGLQGTPGSSGLSILNGTVDPANETGSNGEFYINTSTNNLFGPKAGGVWPAGVSLVGPEGPAGSFPPGTEVGNTPYWDGSAWVTNSTNIYNNGTNVGIGTNTPATKLDVIGSIKITDGSEGVGKILSSDASGLAIWSNPTVLNPCAQCEIDYNDCVNSQGGDPEMIAVCYDLYLACRSGCDVVGLSEAIKIEAFPRNSVFGYNASIGGSATNSTAIGWGAGTSTSNAIQLGNSDVTQVFAGTGSNATLITGGLKVTGGSPGAGKVLTSDATGIATWQTVGGSGWGLLGSTGTVDGTNFIGTTDNVALSFRVNNQKAGRIDPAGPVFIGYQAGNSNTAPENTAVGYQALFTNTTGDYNAATGREALALNTTGNGNSASGYRSIRANTTGSLNTGSGSLTLWNNTTGSENTAVGFQALAEAKAGSRGTSIGANSMRYYTSTTTPFTNSNVAVGYESLRGSTSVSSNTGTENTAVGYQTLMNNSGGSVNSAFGYQALMTISTGSQNTAIGSYALRVATGSINTAVGHDALSALGGGSDNTAIGAQSMQTMTSGNWNTAIGKNSLRLNAGGNYNTAIGFEALLSNSTGNNNTALGANANVGSGALTNAMALGNGAVVNSSNAIQLGNSSVTQVFAGTGTNATLVAGGLKITGGSPAAGKVLTSDVSGVATWQAAGGSGWGLTGNSGTVDGTSFIGTTDNVPLSFKVNSTKAGRIDPALNNTFMGMESGNANATANGNTAFGNRTLKANLAGNDNAAFGDHALFNSTSDQNTAVGAYSLYTTTTGNLNTAVGDLALYSNTTGAGNTSLGWNALFSNTTGQSNTAVGRGADVSLGNLTNATAIGNGAIVTASNTIQLGNASVVEATVGNGNSSILKVGEVRVGSSGEFNYTTAKARNLTLGNAAFVAAGPDGMTASRNVTTVAGIPTSVYTINGPASPAVSSFTAQVNLPDGAIITGLTGYVFDSNATYDLSVILTRQAVGTLTIDNIASITSSGAPSATSYTTNSISNGTVDNSGYSYQVVFQSLANGNHAVYNVKIAYTVGRAD